MHPFYVIRAMGGGLFLAGALLMAFNLWKTVNAAVSGAPADLRLAPAE
jgi:cytochrome c oxidase cbb3-type subunit 1